MDTQKIPATATSQQELQTTKVERFSYWSYFFGQSMSYTMINSFLATYLVLSGIQVGKIALAMITIKVWDAVNDIIFGFIFDRIKFKSGQRSLPWLKLTLFFIPIATFIVFATPQSLSTNGKVIWFVIAYIIWDSVYTISDIPIYNLNTLMTSNIQERNRLLSVGRVFAILSAIITSVVVMTLVGEKVGLSFTYVALLFSLIVFLAMLPITFKGKERVENRKNGEEDHYSFKEMTTYLKKNKYLLIFYSGYLISGLLATDGALGLFVSYYLFGSTLVSTAGLLVSVVPALVIGPFIGRILTKFDKFRLLYVSYFVVVAVQVLLFFFGQQSLTIYLILMFLRAIPGGFIITLNLTFTPDLVEYGEFKTGVDARGIAFAIQAFAAKLLSIAQPIGLFVLSIFGWQTINATSFQEIQRLQIVQSPSALKGLWITATLIPAIGYFLALIPFSFYKLNDKDVQIMAEYNAGLINRETAEKSLSRKY